MDNRKFNSGTRGNKGGGRKPKAEEERIIKLSTDAIIEVYGSEKKYWEHLARESKDSFPHFRLLQEYRYGKVRERIEADINSNNKDDIISKLMDLPNSVIENVVLNNIDNGSE